MPEKDNDTVARLMEEITGIVKDTRAEMPRALEEAARMAAQEKYNSMTANAYCCVVSLLFLSVCLPRLIKKAKDSQERFCVTPWEILSWVGGLIGTAVLLVSFSQVFVNKMDGDLIRDNPRGYIINRIIK